MPEGPEIRRAADRIARVLVGRAVVEVDLNLPELRRFEARLTGRRVTAIDTRGKAMLTRFDNDLTLYSHNQLYGRWYVTRRPKLPNTPRQLRVALHTEDHSALLYSASDLAVLTPRQLAQHPFLLRAGPDILDPALTAAQVVDRLRTKPFRNRALAGLYLDQSFLAGVGNYLRSEILWAARADPAARPAQLPGAALDRLATVTLRLSRRSYRTGGLTAPPAQVKRLKAQGLSRGQYRFQVYGRARRACYRCGSRIERRVIGGRAMFVCPACQS